MSFKVSGGVTHRIVAISMTLAIVAFGAIPAFASDIPRYEPEPEWVEKQPADDYLGKRDTEFPLLTVYDKQAKIEGTEMWTYTDLALKAETPDLLNRLGNLTLQWNPAKGDLIVHRLQILRGGETINVLGSGKKFEVMRRETELQALQLTGILTAVMVVEGLKLGDVVRITSTVTSSEPATDNNFAVIERLVTAPTTLGYGKLRTMWPNDLPVKWSVVGTGATSRLGKTKDGRFTELNVPMPLPKQPDAPSMAPLRYTINPLLLVSTFSDWPSVSRTNARHYQVKGQIADGSPLALEADKIAAATKDPRERTALALRFVQDEIRYLYSGLGTGNYVPQSPNETWQLRYGDCKAKTFLLLALLDRLQIDAIPVLVSAQGVDQVSKVPASMAIFDHIIVRASVNGQHQWLDGTLTGSRLANIDDVPNFRFGLPTTLAGEELQEIAFRAPSTPTMEIDQVIDARAGIAFPAPYKLTMTMRGPLVDFLKAAKQGGNAKSYNEAIDGVVGNMLGDANVVRRAVESSADGASVVIKAEGLQTMSWPKEGSVRKLAIKNLIDDYEPVADRARPEWREIPVTVPIQEYTTRKTVFLLPESSGTGFTVEGGQVNQETLTGIVFDRKLAVEGNKVTLNENWRPDSWEIPFERFASDKGRLAQIRATPLRLVVPAGYPAAPIERREAMAANRLKPIIEMYDAAIAAEPEEVVAIRNRALFYSGVGDKKNAAADVARILKIEASADDHAWRASLLSEIEPKEAILEAEKALALDPGQVGAVSTMVSIMTEAGRTDDALALLDRPNSQAMGEVPLAISKAHLLDTGGRINDAIALLDAANIKRPGNPELLNARCWTRARNKLELDFALKDCTRAIELSGEPEAALDSRGLVYFQLGRYQEALDDFEAALTISDSIASSLFMRGIVKQRRDKSDASAKTDIALAQSLSPKVIGEFAKIGIKPEIK